MGKRARMLSPHLALAAAACMELEFLLDWQCRADQWRQSWKISKILDRITAGEGKEGDIELLEELSEFMELASLCAFTILGLRRSEVSKGRDG